MSEEDVPSVRTFTYVKLAFVGNQLAIVEASTNEPIQFVIRQNNDPVLFQKHVENLASQWDEHFAHRRRL